MARRKSSARKASAPARQEAPEREKGDSKPQGPARAGRQKSSPAKSAKDPVSAGSLPKAFPLVGVGASAGGLEAFTDLLAHLPPDTGMGFVLIQHLDPKHESMLSSILARSTKMRVREVEAGMPLEPDTVYVAPPAADISLVDGSFELAPRDPSAYHRQMPIDHFFRALAESYKTQAV